jgi:hypothetical protein
MGHENGSKILTEGIILAADGLSIATIFGTLVSRFISASDDEDLPGVTRNANDRNRRASDSDRDVNVLDDDAQEAKEFGDVRGTSGLNTIAALNRASGALSTAVGGGRGNRGQSGEGNSDQVELHVE